MMKSLGSNPEGARLERMKALPLWAGEQFRNLHPIMPGLRDPTASMPTLSEFICGGERRVPQQALPSLNPLDTWLRPPGSGLRVTWLGHSTLLIEIDGERVLTDPVWGKRASPSQLAGPKRFQPVPVPLRAMPPVDLVLVSHDHYDHLDYPTIRERARRDLPFVTSLGVGAHLEAWGVRPERIVELDWWESHQLPNTAVTVTAAPSQHFSGRRLKNRNSTLWSSFVIRSQRHAVFFSGDTGLTPGYRAIRDRLGPFDLPTIVVSSGPMLNGKFRGRDIGSGTDVWKFSEAVRAGEMPLKDFMSAESGMSRTPGTCMTMGSASTMASMVEAMGIALPFNATAPAVDAQRRRIAHESGRLIVRMALEDMKLSKILTPSAFHNAVRVLAAIGGSTNTVLHLLALAGRLGVPLDLAEFDRLSAGVPLLVDLQPSGRFLMEELHYAGGLPAVMKELGALLHTDAPTASGPTLGQSIAAAKCFNREVIRAITNPVKPMSGIWVLKGNLCPDGAVMKPSAAGSTLFSHRGRAVVFESIEDLRSRIDDPALEVDEHCILVLKGCGPKGYPGMPEVGNLPLPRKLLERGIKDMVRISDARMSGTAYETVVLHVAPEAEAGGPLAVVRNGDEILLDGPNRRLELLVSDEELKTRLAEWRRKRPQPKYTRGYYRLYIETVMQANQGCDLDFLTGASGSIVDRESH